MFRPEHIQSILNDEAMKWALSQVEKDNLEAAIVANDPEQRATLLAEVRAIRSVWRKLTLVAGGHVTPADDTGAYAPVNRLEER